MHLWHSCDGFQGLEPTVERLACQGQAVVTRLLLYLRMRLSLKPNLI
jgi:hypothetical protein